MPILTLHALRGIHPMSAVCDDESAEFRPGNWYDTLTGKGSATVAIQLLGYRETREMVRRLDYPTDLYPELEVVEPETTACMSSNGRESSQGVYVGRACASCPHAMRRCREQVSAVVRNVETDDEKPRQVMFRGAGLPTWTEIVLESHCDEVTNYWDVVFVLKGRIVKAGPGKAFIAQVVETRPATADEKAAAERLARKTVGTLLRLIEQGALALAPAQDPEPEMGALPAGDPEAAPAVAATAGGNGKGRGARGNGKGRGAR